MISVLPAKDANAREDGEGSLVGLRCGGVPSAHEAFPFEFGIGAEIHEEADFVSGGVEIIDELRGMFRCERGNGFDFYQNGVEAVEVRDVFVIQRFSPVSDFKWLLRREGDCGQREFTLEAFLINRLQESAAHTTMDFHARTDDFVALFLVY
jgi:hypothetical protein